MCISYIKLFESYNTTHMVKFKNEAYPNHTMREKGGVRDFVHIVYDLMPGFKGMFVMFFSVILLGELIKFIPPYIVKLIVDGVVEGKALEYLFLLLGLMFIMLSVMTFINVFVLTKVASSAAEQQKTMQEKSFAKLLRLPLSWHGKQNTGSIVSKLVKASNYIAQLIWFINSDIIPSLIQLILTGGVLFWVDWRIGLIYTIFSPLILYMVNKQFKESQPYREKYHHEFEEATKIFAQGMYNIKTVKDYVQEEKEAKEQIKHLERFRDNVKGRTDDEFWKISMRDILTNVVRVLSIGFSIYLVSIGELTPGDLVFVFTIVEKAFLNLHRLGRIYSFMGDTYSALERAHSVQQTENTLKDEGTRRAGRSDLKFVDVSFSYGDGTVLKRINLAIPEKRTTAIVGPSGSGKSTLVNLIMRHYDPTRGKIMLGDIDLRDIPLNHLRKKMAFVSQHTEIFDRTAHENIAYGRPKATREQVIRAAKMANAHKFIKDFPKGYDTVLGERGVRLSGGQKQRVSIARALLSDADIIIFDEATSSLDSESEKEIQKAILKIRGKTVIVIAHRFSTIEHADNIVVMKKMKVVEQGTHSELLNRSAGLYKKMRELQKLGELRK